MEKWKKILSDSITGPEGLPSHLAVDRERLREVAKRYPMRITPHYLGLIRGAGDPIWRQCVPDPAELCDDQRPDPLNEAGLSPVPGLIHRYPDRVVWLVSSRCAVYCRFCMRKGRVGCPSGMSSPASHIDKVVAYLAEHEAVRDVILSGGDPLLLDDDLLESILARLRGIPHLEIIRIGTRVPVTLPERITVHLARMLKRHHPLFINTHFNHPLEITEQAVRACARLADAGIPLGNQTVLLRGVNDDPAVMKRLMQRLLAIRVRPYYIHQMDLVRGTGHFRTPVERGVEIMAGLRGHTSGLANPYYVIDLAGGKGKVPILPECVRREGGKLLLTNYRGEVVEYSDR
ncbi:MAG TPA: KamA family radical SAM protein [Geobacteraceae bacterium]